MPTKPPKKPLKKLDAKKPPTKKKPKAKPKKKLVPLPNYNNWFGEEKLVWKDLSPAERVEIWVAALRSGAFKQGTGRLCTLSNRSPLLSKECVTLAELQPKGSFCCLGVACALMLEYDQDMVFNPTYSEFVSEKRAFSNEFVLDSSMAEEFGLSPEDIDLLIKLNDSHKGNFKLIADVIEGLTDRH